MKIVAIAKRLLDPNGPIGQWLSPSEVYKDRAGLPIASPHSLRVDSHTAVPGEIARAVQVKRYVAFGEEVPPSGRTRLVGRYIIEDWSPVYATTDSENILDAITASQTQVGWNVTQRVRNPYCDCTHARFSSDGTHSVCGRARRSMDDAEYIEHVQSLTVAHSDEYLNGFYETIKGKDTIMTTAGPATGGHRITGGRAEYRRLTRNMIHWDKGYIVERARYEADDKQKKKDSVRVKAEIVSKRSLPRKLGEL
jgi:hypothetical protein